MSLAERCDEILRLIDQALFLETDVRMHLAGEGPPSTGALRASTHGAGRSDNADATRKDARP